MIKRKQCKMNRVEEQNQNGKKKTERQKVEAMVKKKRVRKRRGHHKPFVVGRSFSTQLRMKKSRKLTRTYEISHFNYFFSVYYRNVKWSPTKVSIIVEHLNRDRI